MNWGRFKDPVSCMCLVGVCGSILVYYTRGGRLEVIEIMTNYSVKLFKKNSIEACKTRHQLPSLKLPLHINRSRNHQGWEAWPHAHLNEKLKSINIC